jgi:hypothetical protein
VVVFFEALEALADVGAGDFSAAFGFHAVSCVGRSDTAVSEILEEVCVDAPEVVRVEWRWAMESRWPIDTDFI